MEEVLSTQIEVTARRSEDNEDVPVLFIVTASGRIELSIAERVAVGSMTRDDARYLAESLITALNNTEETAGDRQRDGN